MACHPWLADDLRRGTRDLAQTILSHEFANGLILVAEPMAAVESAAFNILAPAGAIYDPPDRSGLATVTAEMMLRGSGSRNSRQFVSDLENLGVQRGESVSSAHVSLGGATLAKNLPAALRIYADLLRQPHLPPEQLDASRAVTIQELHAIEDDPSHKVMLELKRRHYPIPGEGLARVRCAALEAIDDR